MTGPTSVFDLPLESRLDLVPALRGLTRTVAPLSGGLTNTNCHITTSTGHFVARLSQPVSGLLAIDREAEYRNSVAAATTGIAPRVVDFVPTAGVLMIDWVDGRTLDAADLRRDEMLPRLAAACRRLHAGPRFTSDFDMFEIRDRYLETCQERQFRLPDRYLDFTPQWERLRSVLAMQPPTSVPCHNDLLAANFIDDGRQLWLIDYEYSGNNDPCFELGNIWTESDLAEDRLGPLVDAYFGEHRPDLTARARLQAVVSQYGWTLWGVIQHNISELDFDFWNWGVERFDKAVAAFESPAMEDLLTAAGVGQRSARVHHFPEGDSL